MPHLLSMDGTSCVWELHDETPDERMKWGDGQPPAQVYVGAESG